MQPPHRRLTARIIWTAALVAATVPFLDLHAHTHWAKVGWVPFVTPPIKTSDIAVNVLLYVPFGFLARGERAARRVWRVAASAAALSFAIEASQLFSHSRFPSASDLCCNVLGAAIGATVSYRRRRS